MITVNIIPRTSHYHRNLYTNEETNTIQCSGLYSSKPEAVPCKAKEDLQKEVYPILIVDK